VLRSTDIQSFQNTLERGARPYTSPSFGWQTAMRDAHALGH
jgi:hypothetical protein